MRRMNSVRLMACAMGALWLTVTASGQTMRAPVPAGFAAMDADEIKTGTIWGDPSKPGMYVTRNLFKAGAGSQPHWHDQDRYVTVIKGTWYVSLGPESDSGDRSKMTAMKPGSFVFHPAMGHHFDGAKDEDALVQIMGMGPVKTIQLNPPAPR